MGKIAIVYGTSTGVTEEIAKRIKTYFDNADVYDAAKVKTDQLEPYDYFIFGASTTGFGDLQDDWVSLLPQVAKMDLSNKIVALFGLGDSASYSTSFVGALAQFYDALKDKTKIIGAVPTDGYDFEESDAVVDGMFVGLPLDEDNEADKTDERISAWVDILKKDFK